MSASTMRTSNTASRSATALAKASGPRPVVSSSLGLAPCNCTAPCACRSARSLRGRSVAAAAAPAAPTQAAPAKAATAVSKAAPGKERDLHHRHKQVREHFPTALGVDDWISRVETVLAGYGFTGDNSIACTNLCRDEVTAVLKDKIEHVFGSSFNTNGLGGVLTCGVTGMGAGLSHSPICDNGRERYVFFSFPHIAIDSKGQVGAIARPGRAGTSCACGALAKALGEFKKEGINEATCKVPGVHDALDPEYSILKQRLARRLRSENVNANDLTLPSITAAAERTITNDLEFLIGKAVDLSKADYAVVTGVQIHNWSTDLTPEGEDSMEFVAPTKLYVVVNGSKIDLDLNKVPTMSPRQLMLMASASIGETIDGSAVSHSNGSTLQPIPLNYLLKQMGGATMS